MIDLSSITSSGRLTNIVPSDNIFRELGKNTYSFKDMLSELIDNSIAARIIGEDLKVYIGIYYSDDNKAEKLIYIDNASGIEEDRLGLALSPAAIQTQNSLNEHGMGMKQAIAGIGEFEYLATKVRNEDSARVITELKYGDIETYSSTEFSGEHGIEISIKNVRPIVTANPSTITKYIVPYLGARYRNYLKSDNKILTLDIKLINESTQIETNGWNVRQVKPIYFHPSKRINEPVICNLPINGEGWKAELTFGYAPANRNELDEMSISKPEIYEPYYVSLGKQGIDILLHDRVILFHQLSELGIVGSKHPSLNTIRGEIKLKNGFSTAITKNSIMEDRSYQECIKKIKEILTGEADGPRSERKDYIMIKTYPEKLPEALVRDRLSAWLISNPLAPRSNIQQEFSVGGIDGHIDILADSEAWEIKTEQASAYDVYQLFMYMDVGGYDKGFLVAKDFTSGARYAASFIQENHNKEIVLSPLSAYPINHPANSEEREDYYKRKVPRIS